MVEEWSNRGDGWAVEDIGTAAFAYVDWVETDLIDAGWTVVLHLDGSYWRGRHPACNANVVF